MKHVIVLLLIAIFISCQKDSEKPSLPGQPGTAAVRLQLQGDFLTSEGPLPYGREAGGMYSYAKTLRDSTLYAVMVSWLERGWVRHSSGLFNRPDSIMLLLPEERPVYIHAWVIRKGSGEGPHYEMRGGLQYFDSPLNTELTNQMDTLHRQGDDRMVDTVSGIQVSDPADLLQPLPRFTFPEVDAHYGTISFPGTLPSVVNLPMKRMAFGVQLAADNFTTGKLLLEFPSPYYLPAQSQSVTPATLSEIFIYAGEEFKAEAFWWPRLEVSIKWVKTPGDTVALGQKYVQFKRNVLTRLKVTLPTAGRSSAPAGIIETHSPLPQ